MGNEHTSVLLLQVRLSDFEVEEDCTCVLTDNFFCLLRFLSNTSLNVDGIHQVGKFQYKYIVDGEWRQHSNQPTEQDEHGNLNNVVEVVEQQSAFDPNEPPAPVEPLSPVESYDYAIPNTEELRVSDVPELPAYYLNPILNKEDIIGGKLAVPSHVCVGHLHTATRHFEGEKVTVLGITQRWRGKFITTVIYTPRGEAD